MFNVKSFFILLLTFLFIFTTAAVAQRSKPAKNTTKSTELASANNAAKTADKEAQAAFEALKNIADAGERIERLNEFITDFPRSELRIKAVEMLIISHVEVGEASFQSGDKTSGSNHFRRAPLVFEPVVSDGIFNDVIAKLPFNLFFRGEQVAAFEVAREIEPKIKDNAQRLLTLANFYLSTENADAAKRLATRAAEAAPDLSAAQISLGMAYRISFNLEAASQAYARAVELDSASIVAKRNLADALRGLGQTEEALKLYRELLSINAADEAARNGLVLSLFNAGSKDEAEKELTTAIEQNPKNIVLQTGAAYWYAANGDGKRAVEFAQKAVETEPRYVWGQIALARGLLLEKRPLEAEHALITAKQYGKFPTLDYELANAHFAAGLYDEAVDDLRRSFTLKNGKLETKLAGRSANEADNFIELLSRERRASIFEPTSASGEIEARKLKELLALAAADEREYSDKNFDENALLKAAQDFAGDADEMRAHRELYAAGKLLNRKIAAEQILEMTQSATNGLEKSLDVPAATAAILADELYAPRRLAATNGNIVNIPVLPRETLRQIMRGRVEEIAGWTLYQQNKLEEAAARLRRAVGVLPENSAWWRSSYWRLGSALDAGGKPKEALAAYLKSYQADLPNETRLIIIQALYQRVYGSLDGLEERLSRTESINSTKAFEEASASERTPSSAIAASASIVNPLPNVIAEINVSKPIETPKSESPSVTETKSEIAPPIIPSVATMETEVNKEIVAAASIQPDETTSETKSASEVVAASTPEIESVTQLSPTIELKTEKNPELETEVQAKNSDQVITNPENKTEIEAQNKTENKTETTSVPVAESSLALSPAEIKLPPSPEQNAELTVTNDEKNVGQNSDLISTEKADADSILSRPRVIIRSANPPIESGSQATGETKSQAACLMQPSQSELSVLRNGGTVAFLVKFNDAADAAELKISVSSPNDISAILLPRDDITGDYRLVQVSSTSETAKIYTITLESLCGKQEIKVKVR